mgnify:CR=1 FL=1
MHATSAVLSMAGSRISGNGRNTGTMRRAGSYGRNGTEGEEHHLFRQSAMALSQRVNGSFIADYESGEIKLQANELSSGAFYSKDNLPEIPRKLSIARKLIDWWLENN